MIPAGTLLSESQRRLLLAIAQGMRLKDHRDIEGTRRMPFILPTIRASRLIQMT